MARQLTMVAILTLFVLAAPQAMAQQGADKAKGKGAAKMEQALPDKAREKTKNRAGGEDRDVVDAMDEDAHERAEEMREQAEERAEQDREQAEEAAEGEEVANEGPRGRDNAATRGNEKSQEMRARRDERKQIMEEYKGEGAAESTEEVMEGDVAEQSGQQKAKKPWWKFWGD